jgi:hypothetical protein
MTHNSQISLDGRDNLNMMRFPMGVMPNMSVMGLYGMPTIPSNMPGMIPNIVPNLEMTQITQVQPSNTTNDQMQVQNESTQINKLNNY